jgi:hypothetical protein
MKSKAAKKIAQKTSSSPDSIELLKGALTDEPSIGNTLNLLVAFHDAGVLHLDSAAMQIEFIDKYASSDIRPIKGRQTNTQKINEKKLNYLISATRSYLGGQNNSLKSISKEARERWIEKVKANSAKLTNDQLLEKFANLTFDFECLKQDLAALRDEKSYLSKLFITTLSGRQKTVSAQTKKKDEKFAPNNACMQECLDEVLNSGLENKPLSKSTYTKFCRLVKKKYPTPPVLQQPRLSKAEKLQSAADQKADREALTRNEWAPITLRNFFEKTLKVKIKDLPK